MDATRKLKAFQDVENEVSAVTTLKRVYEIFKAVFIILFVLGLIWGITDALFWISDLEETSLLIPVAILILLGPTLLLFKLVIMLYQSLVNISTNLFMIQSDVEQMSEKSVLPEEK